MENKLPYYTSVNKAAYLIGVRQNTLSAYIKKNSPAFYDKSLMMVDLNHPDWIAYAQKKRLQLSVLPENDDIIKEQSDENDEGATSDDGDDGVVNDDNDDSDEDDGVDYSKLDQVSNYSEIKEISKLNVALKMLEVEKRQVDLSIKKKKLIDRTIFGDACFGYLAQLNNRLLICAKNLAVDTRSMVLGGKTNDDVEDFIHKEIGAIIEQAKKTIVKTLDSV